MEELYSIPDADGNADDSVLMIQPLVNNELSVTYYNGTFSTFFNLSSTGNTTDDVCPDTIPEVFKTQIFNCINTGIASSFRHISFSGEEKHFWLTQVLPLFSDQPAVEYVICVSKNINSLEMYEGDTVKSKILLDRLYEIFPAAIFITNDKGFIIECNAAAETIFGFLREEYLGMSILEQQEDIDFIATDFTLLQPYKTPSTKAFQQKTTIENEIFGLKKKNKEVIWVSASSAWLDIPGYGVVSTYRNITTQQNQEQSILEQKKILQSIINSSFDIIVFLDTDLKITWYNTEAEKKIYRLFGDKIQNGEYAEYILNDDPKEKLVNYIKEAQEKKVFAYEHSVTSFDGEILWYYRRYHPAYNERGEYMGCVIISTNITERKQKELHIKNQNSKLKEIARVQSHELRRPLANIMGLISLLLEEAEKDVDIDILSQADANAKELDKVILKITRRTEPG